MSIRTVNLIAFISASIFLLGCSDASLPAEENELLALLQQTNELPQAQDDVACVDNYTESRACDEAKINLANYLGKHDGKEISNWICEVSQIGNYGVLPNGYPAVWCTNGLSFKMATNSVPEKIYARDVISLSGRFHREDASIAGDGYFPSYGTITNIELISKGS